jgi:hypothetical protein
MMVLTIEGVKFSLFIGKNAENSKKLQETKIKLAKYRILYYNKQQYR